MREALKYFSEDTTATDALSQLYALSSAAENGDRISAQQRRNLERQLKRFFADLFDRLHDRDCLARPTRGYTAMSSTNLAFICYSRKDQKWVEELKKHLKPRIDIGELSLWQDINDSSAGSRFRRKISEAIDVAKVAILFVSPNFCDSDFIYKEEIPLIFERERQGKIRVAWIYVNYCDYVTRYDDLKEITSVSSDLNKPLADLARDEADLARELTHIAKTIANMVTK